MNKDNKEKVMFFPNLMAVECAIRNKQFEKEVIHTEIDWDSITDATIEALTKQTMLSSKLCRKIVVYARANCDENPDTFIELVQNWEFIVTELMSEGLIVEKGNDTNTLF